MTYNKNKHTALSALGRVLRPRPCYGRYIYLESIMKKSTLLLLFFLITACGEKELEVVKVEYSSEYALKDRAILSAGDNEIIISVDLITGKKYSYDYPPSYLLTNEPINIDAMLTGEETWYNLERDDNGKAEVIMTSDWVEVKEPDWTKMNVEYEYSKFVRLIFVVDRNVKEGFLNMRDHRSVKLNFEY